MGCGARGNIHKLQETKIEILTHSGHKKSHRGLGMDKYLLVLFPLSLEAK